MSMDHKAFLFDYGRFSEELLPILEKALSAGNHTGLRSFILHNLGSLADPYEGNPLTSDWEAMIETRDAHQYGDFALTKYYDPSLDIGLGPTWFRLQDLIETDLTDNGLGIDYSPILGRTVGPTDNLFDPGKMGSFFQSASQVEASYRYCLSLSSRVELEEVSRAIETLQAALSFQRGLYVTF